ncbi:MAG: small, acid-soluble spore protein, alpha/beta type [Bacillota bacterium]|uniref:Small, acid-soluble spore protein, alpha/beta type n=2 Tax=Carboxydocella TaxID=178898 RepID=A0A1T4N8S6_9FIRM|nr:MULTISPECIES: alpha/beta-type small acid-soluble spore protein [Carboxydocella]AVX20950.1 Small, acid-soluble spore protein, alpha/beta type [Carboxydocella thermautotrophica]AVX31364.1 Small, acid-soluble spore protein, alpha/beta type [Carboxydocella thermautotrophica]SJZ75700.1 Small, acid-soluble spore protein, alpha/beta type [Carboxydocella sporoproducens DSM 16521]GAW29887.1 acid soluble spore domain protein [Carboxydocella sp. ULO1]GAW32512.1 acid soluble spore domain protein [Carbo
MPGGRNTNQPAVPGAKRALEQFKMEVANEIGLAGKIQTVGYENMTSRECGSIGGWMTKKMVQLAEQALAGRVQQ